MTPVLVFDIETVPDVDGLRRLLDLPEDVADDDEVVEAALEVRREQRGERVDTLPAHQQRVVALSCVVRDDAGLRVRSIGEPGDPEQKLVHGFFRMVEHYSPQLVSWDGAARDLAVLHYRAMVLGIPAARYWAPGEADAAARHDNYPGLGAGRHADLSALLSRGDGALAAPLAELARQCGFPGGAGLDAAMVWPAFRSGQLGVIRAGCEVGVVNAWLLWTRFQLVRGALTREQHDAEIALARRTLAGMPGEHWQAFLGAWPD